MIYQSLVHFSLLQITNISWRAAVPRVPVLIVALSFWNSEIDQPDDEASDTFSTTQSFCGASVKAIVIQLLLSNKLV